AELRRLHLPAGQALDVLARLHLADDLGVGARPPDAALLELANERPFVVAGRRLRALLFGDDPRRRDDRPRLACLALRQEAFFVLGAARGGSVRLRRLTLPCFVLAGKLARAVAEAAAVLLEPAGKLEHFAARTKLNDLVGRTFSLRDGLDVHAGLIVDGV